MKLLKTNPVHLFAVVSKLFHLYKRKPNKTQQQWYLKNMEKIRVAEFFRFFVVVVNNSSQKQKKN